MRDLGLFLAYLCPRQRHFGSQAEFTSVELASDPAACLPRQEIAPRDVGLFWWVSLGSFTGGAGLFWHT